MSKVVVFMKRGRVSNCTFEVVDAALFPGLSFRPITAEEVFSLAVPSGPGTMHPFVACSERVSQEVLVELAASLNSLYITFTEEIDMGAYDLLQLLTMLPGWIDSAEDLRDFVLPKPGEESLRRVFCSKKEVLEKAANEAQLERAAQAASEELPHLQRPSGTLETTLETALARAPPEAPVAASTRRSFQRLPEEEFSAAAIARTRASYLKFSAACEKALADLSLLRDDVQAMTSVALDVLGIPEDPLDTSIQVNESLGDIRVPCATREQLQRLVSCMDRSIGESIVLTALRSATRGCVVKDFHRVALRSLFSEELLADLFVPEIEDLPNPYTSHGRQQIPGPLLNLYTLHCHARTRRMFTPEQQQYFWFSLFGELEATYRRRKFYVACMTAE